MTELLASAIVVLLGFGRLQHLRKRSVLLTSPAGGFGVRDADEEGVRAAILRQWKRQQDASFVLLWLTVAAGASCAAVLVGRWVATKQLSITDIGLTMSIAIDIGLSRGAWRLYGQASDRLERASGTKTSGPVEKDRPRES
jgi:hypothetical protein